MIFFSDMDGTFLNSKKEVTPTGRRALDELASRGLEFVPCTGRAAAGVPDELLEHPAVHYVVSSNGAVVVRLDETAPTDIARGKVLRSTPLPIEKALAVWNISKHYDVTYDVFADGDCFTPRRMWDRLDEFIEDPYILMSMRTTRTPRDEEVPEILASAHTIERVSMYWKDPADRDAINAQLAQMPGIDLMRSYPMNIEVMEKGASKGAAMIWLCEHLGMGAADAVAFGDNINYI